MQLLNYIEGNCAAFSYVWQQKQVSKMKQYTTREHIRHVIQN